MRQLPEPFQVPAKVPSLTRRQVIAAASASMMAGTFARPAIAQSGAYPVRQVKLIVPFPAGGPVDTLGRVTAQKLSELWGQPVVVDNRAGAGGIVGAEFAAKQPADGYSVFLCAIHHSVLPALKPNLPYNIEKDFVPVSFGTLFPVVLVAHPSVPVRTVAELIALAKSQPGKLSFASSGNGGGTHLAGELFNMHAGTQLLHVPYKGSAPAMNDLLGGQVQLMFSDAPTALAHIKSGRVRAIAVASAQRSALLPDLPTIAESGLPDYEAYSWAGFVLPAGTPKDIVARLNADIGKVLGQADVKQRLHQVGAEAMPGSPEQFARTLNQEITKWGKVVKAGNIQAD
jgi:tripartite-type tricarboxylate transporter receptor subunit TctC